MGDTLKNLLNMYATMFATCVGLIIFLGLAYKIMTYKIWGQPIVVWIFYITIAPIYWLFSNIEGTYDRRYGGVPNIFGILVFLMLILLLLSLLGIID